MEIGMTDYQYKTILQSIKMILSGCKTVEEAQEKIDILLGKEEKKENSKEWQEEES